MTFSNIVHIYTTILNLEAIDMSAVIWNIILNLAQNGTM